MKINHQFRSREPIDWRKIKEPRMFRHLCLRWFHWDIRPRWYTHYYSKSMGEMRYTKARHFLKRLG